MSALAVIHQIVDRQHISMSDYRIIREVVSRLVHGRKTFLSMPKDAKCLLVSESVKRHRHNREQFTMVMKGNFR